MHEMERNKGVLIQLNSAIKFHKTFVESGEIANYSEAQQEGLHEK